jgi:hypothetical protein
MDSKGHAMTGGPKYNRSRCALHLFGEIQSIRARGTLRDTREALTTTLCIEQ